MAGPAWLAKAHEEMGVEEVAGAESNPRILEYYASVGHAWVKDDSKQAWCGYFLAWLFKDTHPLPAEPWRARAWEAWGDPIGEPVPGAVGIMPRTSDPALGHVFLFVQWSKDRQHVYGLGGNQGDKVCIQRFPARKVIWRWPPKEKVPKGSEIANGSKIKREAKELVGVGGATVATGTAGKILDVPAPPTETMGQLSAWQAFGTQAIDFLTFCKANWWMVLGVIVTIAGVRIYRWRVQDAKDGSTWSF